MSPWFHGGETSLLNGVLLCSHHHHVIHEGDWVIRFTDDGVPEFIPPRWIDPDQVPQRNIRSAWQTMIPFQRDRYSGNGMSADHDHVGH